MALIKTTAELRGFLRVDLSEKEASWQPFVAPAMEKYIRPVLGDALLEELDAYYEEGDTDAELGALLPYVQEALAKFTLFLAVPNLDLNISEGGFTVRSTPQQAPASRERVLALQASLEQQGWDAIESLLRFLETNIDDYASWETSDAYTLAIRNLVNSAMVFDNIYNIGQSRLKFNSYRSSLDDADLLQIIPTISQDMFDALMVEIKAADISEENQKILPLLQRAEVFYAVAERLDKSKYEGIGVEINTQFMRRDVEEFKFKAQRYLEEAMAIMKAAPDDYPEYSDSDKYQEAVDRFENDEDNGVFIFGTPI
jgi:hypothetical protein